MYIARYSSMNIKCNVLICSVCYAVSDEGDEVKLLPQQQKYDNVRGTSCGTVKVRNNIGFW